MSDVPDELLREILSRLPVAPLLRFRCVAKSWKGLIDSQEFIKCHLNHTRKTNSSLHIILSGECQQYFADSELLHETNQANFQELFHPLTNPFTITDILGSCDGLLVLRNHEDDETILFNPSVRSFQEISSNGLEIPGYRDSTFYGFGFGYDFVSDDYKLISIVQSSGEEENSEFYSDVQVYSLKSDSWRTIPDFPYYIKPSFGKTDAVLVNGALHWIVNEIKKWGSDDLVAAFDLGTEEYRLVPLPNFEYDDDPAELDVVVLGGCLSLVCYLIDDQVDVWVMKEYGVQESWSILFSCDFCDFGSTMRPLAYSKCGRKVLLAVNKDVLRWYDLDNNSTDAPLVQIPPEMIDEMYTCSQSLVLLNKDAPDFDLVVKTKRKRKDKKRSSGKRKYFQDYVEY